MDEFTCGIEAERCFPSSREPSGSLTGCVARCRRSARPDALSPWPWNPWRIVVSPRSSPGLVPGMAPPGKIPTIGPDRLLLVQASRPPPALPGPGDDALIANTQLPIVVNASESVGSLTFTAVGAMIEGPGSLS